jgi:hypothetical protein
MNSGCSTGMNIQEERTGGTLHLKGKRVSFKNLHVFNPGVKILVHYHRTL